MNPNCTISEIVNKPSFYDSLKLQKTHKLTKEPEKFVKPENLFRQMQASLGTSVDEQAQYLLAARPV